MSGYCGEMYPSAWEPVRYCTRPAGHDGPHIATLGSYDPAKEELARWPNANALAHGCPGCADPAKDGPDHADWCKAWPKAWTTGGTRYGAHVPGSPTACDGLTVSTVCVGAGTSGDWETMVFNDRGDDLRQWRWGSLSAATRGHEEVVKMVRGQPDGSDAPCPRPKRAIKLNGDI